jgi:hypothetical protein
MSHQNSQQTIKQPQTQIFSTTPTVNLVPPGMEEAKPIPIKSEISNFAMADFQHLLPTGYSIPLAQDLTSPNQFAQPASAPQAWEPFSAPDILATSAPFPSSPLSLITARPTSLSHVAGKISQPPPHCEKCGTVVAKVWRKSLAGALYCERCGTDQHLINVPAIRRREIKVDA